MCRPVRESVFTSDGDHKVGNVGSPLSPVEVPDIDSVGTLRLRATGRLPTRD